MILLVACAFACTSLPDLLLADAGRTEDDIDGYITLDAEIMACATWGGMVALAPNAGRGMLNLCISDVAKQMLISNAGFIPHLVDGLLLNPEHPRNGSDEAIKAIVQRDFAECIQQLSLFAPGCEALKSAGIVEALDALVDKAWTEEAKDSARGALMQLTDRHREVVVEVDPDALHIMLSCACTAVVSCIAAYYTLLV